MVLKLLGSLNSYGGQNVADGCGLVDKANGTFALYDRSAGPWRWSVSSAGLRTAHGRFATRNTSDATHNGCQLVQIQLRIRSIVAVVRRCGLGNLLVDNSRLPIAPMCFVDLQKD